MTGDFMQGWGNFFVAEAGAAAALAGLLFVAISINLTRILSFQHLPTRALEALTALLSVLIVSTWSLIPGQPSAMYGMELAATGVIAWVVHTLALVRTRGAPRYSYALRVFMNQVPSLPFIVAGVLLMAAHAKGVYWVVPGTYSRSSEVSTNLGSFLSRFNADLPGNTIRRMRQVSFRSGRLRYQIRGIHEVVPLERAKRTTTVS